jgi:type IV secretion system protein TrbL
MTVASLWNPITDIGKSAANAVFGALWSEIGNAAQAVTSALWGAITSSTDISFTSVAWRGGSTQHLLAVVLELSGAVMLLMVFLAVVRAVVRGDPGAAARAVLVDLPISCVAAVALVGITAAVVGASDQAADQIMSLAPSAALNSFAHNWPVLITNLQFVGGLGGVIFILGAFMVWLELIVRAGLVYLMVATAPLVLAMRIFPGFAPAWKKFVETAVAVILSKVFVAIALVLGLSLTTGGVIPTGTAAGTGADIGQLIAGIAMMALAAFAPFVLLRFVPIVEAALLAQGISHMPARVAQQGMQASYYGQGLSRLAGSGGAAVGAAGGAAGRGEGGAPPGGDPPPGAGSDGPSAAGPPGAPPGGGSAGGGGAGVPSGEQSRGSSNGGSSNDGATTGPSTVAAHDRAPSDRSQSGPSTPGRRTGPATASVGNGSAVEAGPSNASDEGAVPSWPSRTVHPATPRPAQLRSSAGRNLTRDQASVSG